MPNKALFTLKIFSPHFVMSITYWRHFFPPVEFIIFWIGLIVFTWFCLTCSFMPHIFSKWVEQSSGIIRFRLMCSLLEKYFLCNWYYVHSIASLQETHDVWYLLSVNIIVDNWVQELWIWVTLCKNLHEYFACVFKVTDIHCPGWLFY